MGLKAVNFATAIVVAALLTAIPAQTQESKKTPDTSNKVAPTSDLPLADYQAFDTFAVAHPEVVSELSHRPELLKSDAYLTKHPELRDFLDSHAELRASLIEDPGDFLAPNTRRHAPQ
jgi:hypothetical protein